MHSDDRGDGVGKEEQMKIRKPTIAELEFDKEFIDLCEGRVQWSDLSKEVQQTFWRLNRVDSRGTPRPCVLLPLRFPWIMVPGSLELLLRKPDMNSDIVDSRVEKLPLDETSTSMKTFPDDPE